MRRDLILSGSLALLFAGAAVLFLALRTRVERTDDTSDLMVEETDTAPPAVVPAAPVSAAEDPGASVPEMEGDRIWGEVVDLEGNPVYGASYEIRVLNPADDFEGPIHNGKADIPAAKFDLRNLPPGREWFFLVRKQGYAREACRIEDTSGGAHVRVVMERVYDLLVQVVDEQGQFLPSAFVGAQYRHKGMSASCTGRPTPDGGAQILEDVLPDALFVEVSHSGYVSKRVDATLPATEPLVVALDRGHTIRVRVVDSRDEPIEGASVKTRYSHARWTESAETRQVATSAEGIAEFAGIARPHPLEVEVTKTHYPRARVMCEIDAETAVVLDKGCGMVFVLLADGGALPDKAMLRLRRQGMQDRDFVRHDMESPIKNDRCEAWTLRPGTYLAEVTVAGFVPASLKDLVVTEAEPLEVTVPLARGGTLAGVVYDAESGKPMPKVEVSLSRGFGIRRQEVTTGAEGTYRFEHVLGEARVSFTHPERCREILEGLDIREGATLDAPDVVLRKGGAILCRIVNISEGNDSLIIGCRGLQSDDSRGDRPLVGYGMVSSGGRLASEEQRAIRNLHPGTYRLSVSVGGSTTAASPEIARAGPKERWSREVTLPDGVEEIEAIFDLADPPDER